MTDSNDRRASERSAAFESDDADDEVARLPSRERSDCSAISFGSTRNLITDSIQSNGALSADKRDYLLSQFSSMRLTSQSSLNVGNMNDIEEDDAPPAVATAVATLSDTDDDTLEYPKKYRGPPPPVADNGAGSSSLVEYHPDSTAHPTSSSKPKKKGVLRNKGKTGPIKKKKKKDQPRHLTKISAMYDLDGDGVLDKVEQAMRDRDVDGDGQLDHAEIYQIVQDQMKSRKDVILYRKVVAGLVCLVSVLALSNFGTSWASAILARDTVADTETSSIQSKASGEVIGINQIAHEIDLIPLTEEEFTERRLLVDREMAEDPDHEDHIHRRLGKKDKNHACACTKIGYDHGKLEERALRELMRKCDGVNTVSIKRKWKNSDTYDIDTICGPGTNVVKKGKKKNNKNKSKVKVVETQIKFRRKGKGGGNGRGDRDQEIVFDCDKKGYCFGSGQTLLQQEGHPCDLGRESTGAGECDENLFCYDLDGDGRGPGTCTSLVRYARRNSVCDLDFGVDACEVGYACYSTMGGLKRSRTIGVVNTGMCQKLKVRVGNQGVCNAALGSDACDTGFTCLGENEMELNGFGIGYCQRFVRMQRSGGLCDLGLGRDACDNGFYCRDSMLARNGRNGNNGGGNGVGGNAYTNAIISGPSGTIVAGNAAGGQAGVRGRSSGTGTCVRTAGRGGRCSSDDECGWNGNCVGLGADTATGGVIRGSSGTIVWGTGGATTGICG